MSTDMLVAGRHFRLDWSTPHDVGRKAIAQNAADIEAMGAQATAFVVAFGAPADTATSQALELADGMWEEARLLGAGIVGGDLVSAPQWVISVTALGDLGGREPVRRSGAGPATQWRSAGELGRSAAGYALWHSNIRRVRSAAPSASGARTAYGQGRVAADAGATAMTDVSDGLMADLGHVATASGVGIDLSTRRASADRDAVAGAAAAVGADAWAWVLGGGEDHALVATFPCTAAGRLAGDRPRARRSALACWWTATTWQGNPGWQSF